MRCSLQPALRKEMGFFSSLNMAWWDWQPYWSGWFLVHVPLKTCTFLHLVMVIWYFTRTISSSSCFLRPSLSYSLLFQAMACCWNKCSCCQFGCCDCGLSVQRHLQIFESVDESYQPLTNLDQTFQFDIIEIHQQSRTLARYHCWSCKVHLAWTTYFYHTFFN